MKTIKFLTSVYAMSVAPGLPPDTITLDSMSGPELVKLHNLIASNLETNRVNRFSDAKTGAKRTWAMLELYDKEEAASSPAEESEEQAAEQESRPKGGNNRKTGRRFVFPAEDTIKKTREGCARHKALQVLLRKGGATFTEVMEATGWNHKQAYEGIRLIHYVLGYGLKMSSDLIVTEEDERTVKITAHT